MPWFALKATILPCISIGTRRNWSNSEKEGFMFQYLVRFAQCSCAFIIFFLNIACGEELRHIKILDQMMYTINPQAHIEGPIFRDQSNLLEKTQYTSTLVKIILVEADQRAKKYYEAGDFQAYYAFLTLALTTPLHEGVYVHFRNVDGDVCRTDANSGEIVRRANLETYKMFIQYFQRSQVPFLPNCSEMNVTSGVRQMIHGGDGTDLSIMQISIRWHFDDFLANKKYESVSQTLGYGFDHLLSGFDPVYRNIADYGCLIEERYLKKKISYINLIKGVWAGRYNSGSISQTCRFNDVNSPYRKHDVGFSRNLSKVLDFSGTISADYIGDLPLDEISSNAFKEVVGNLRHNSNIRSSLDKLLAKE